MEKEALLDFLKKMGLSLNAFVGYPETHPVVMERVRETGEALRNLGLETNIISMVFLENTVIIGNEKIDGASFPIVSNIIRKYKKIGVESISLNVMAPDSEIAEALKVAARPPSHLKNVKDPNELLLEKGIESITFNAVKVQIGSHSDNVQIDTESYVKAVKKEIESSDYDIDKQFERFLEDLINGIISKRFVQTIKDKLDSGEIVSFIAKAKEMLEKNYGKEGEEVRDFFQNFFKALPQEIKQKVFENISIDIKESLGKLFKEYQSKEGTEAVSKDESVVITDRITFEKMRQKIKDSLDLKDLSELLENLSGMLKSPMKDVRKNAYDTLFKMFEETLMSGKEPFYLRLFTTIIENGRQEKDEEVYEYFSWGLAEMYNICEKYGATQVSKDIINFFSEEINVKEKRLFVLRGLWNIRTTESLNLILSLVWEDVPVEEIKNSLIKLNMDIVKDLFEMLIECDDKDVRLKLIEIICAFGKKASDYALIKIKDDRWYVRRNMYIILRTIGDKSILTHIKNLKEEDHRVKEEMLKTIYHLGGTEEEQFILNFIFDSDYSVAIEALKMIKNMITPRSLPKIMQRFFVNIFPLPMENNIRIILLDILNELRDPRSFETLKRIVTEKKMMSFTYPESIRVKTCEVLSNLKGNNVLELMKTLEKDKNPTIKEIATKYIKENQNQE